MAEVGDVSYEGARVRKLWKILATGAGQQRVLRPLLPEWSRTPQPVGL